MLPNPGSPEAHLRGCCCSRRMNRDGEGAGKKLNGETIYVTHNKCPLHGDDKHRKDAAV